MLFREVPYRRKSQTQRTLFIEKKINEYQDNLTVHGLTRTIKGKRIESWTWITILLAGKINFFDNVTK